MTDAPRQRFEATLGPPTAPTDTPASSFDALTTPLKRLQSLAVLDAELAALKLAADGGGGGGGADPALEAGAAAAGAAVEAGAAGSDVGVQTLLGSVRMAVSNHLHRNALEVPLVSKHQASWTRLDAAAVCPGALNIQAADIFRAIPALATPPDMKHNWLDIGSLWPTTAMAAPQHHHQQQPQHPAPAVGGMRLLPSAPAPALTGPTVAGGISVRRRPVVAPTAAPRPAAVDPMADDDDDDMDMGPRAPDVDDDEAPGGGPFITGRQQLFRDKNEQRRMQDQRGGSSSSSGGGSGNFVSRTVQAMQQGSNSLTTNSTTDASGAARRPQVGLKRKFVPPTKLDDPAANSKKAAASGGTGAAAGGNGEKKELPEELKGLDERMVEMIETEIIDSGDPVSFEDIAGLAFAKKCVIESVVWPLQRPDLFTGLRVLPKGLLLFGPPGTGKTLIGKAVATQCAATFFSISASSLTSKWIGEGEKMVRTLFAVAAYRQPSVIFIDEIDSLLTARSENENESSRRIKTEFLVRLDGAATKSSDRVLLIGATNRPQELDEAARRRFTRRLYIPLPDEEARSSLIRHLLKKSRHALSEDDVKTVVRLCAGYSGADVTNLCQEAAMGPIRSVTGLDIGSVSEAAVPAITLQDFRVALRQVRASVAVKELTFYEKWNREFGSFAHEDSAAPAGISTADEDMST